MFTWFDFFYKERLFIPDFNLMRHSVLLEYHVTPIAGHSGVKATIARVLVFFSWPGIHKEVKSLIKHCDICQHNKYITQKKGFVATFTYSEPGLGGHLYGFYHPSSELFWTYLHLGSLR